MAAVLDTVETPQQAARRLSASALRDGYQPEALHPYTSASGDALFWRIRLKNPQTGDKWIRPMRRDDAGRYVLGEPPAPAAGKPLYNLRDIALHLIAVVIVTEGEKAADALNKRGCVATTSGGAQSADAADWAPLAGRSVLIWPDHDAPGAQYGRDVATRLLALGCAVRIVDVEELGLPPKGDAWDWRDAHPDASAADVLALPTVQPAPLAAPPAPPAPLPAVELVCAANVQPEAVDWLWTDYLPTGKLVLLGGAPGTGKTTIALHLCAVVSAGGYWPDGARCPAGDVVIWSGEDDIASTLVPRLMAAGADLRRVHFVKGRTDGEAFDPACDMLDLEAACSKLPDPRLLLIDPIVSASAGNDHKNNDVRRSLQPVVDLAHRLGMAVIGVHHFSKGTQGRDPVERISGSLAYGALARVVLVCAKEQPQGDEPPRRIFVRAKSNLGPDGGGFAYGLDRKEVAPGVQGQCVIWDEALSGEARDLLRTAEAVNEDTDGSSLSDAMQFLRGLLEDGPLPAKEVMSDANGAGYSVSTIRRAKEALGIEARKIGGAFAPDRKQFWTWALPEDAQDSLKVPNKKGWASSASSEHLQQNNSPADPAKAGSEVL